MTEPLLLEYKPRQIMMPCYGAKCRGCGWNFKERKNPDKRCQDYRHQRPWVDLKPRGYRKVGTAYKRVWRFE